MAKQYLISHLDVGKERRKRRKQSNANFDTLAEVLTLMTDRRRQENFALSSAVRVDRVRRTNAKFENSDAN